MVRICSLGFLIIILLQCAYKPLRQDASVESILQRHQTIEPPLRQDASVESILQRYQTIEPAEIKSTIEALNERRKKNHQIPASSQEHLELAFLYSHYNNPQPDYKRALDELIIYTSVDSELSRRAVIKNWLHMLKEIQRLDSSNKECKKEEMDFLRKEVAKLREENAAMSEKLNQLKNLDIELEEKKRLVK